MAFNIQDFYGATMGQPATPGTSLGGMFFSGAYNPATVGVNPATSGAFSIPSTIGAPPTGYSSAYGGIPAVPSLPATSASAIGTNVGNIPALTGMGGAVNQFNQQQQLGQYQLYNPALMSSLAKSASNIGQELSGQLPTDVADYIAQTAAERGISLGIPGSQASQYNFLRGLGLSSLDMTKLGESNLTAAMGRTPKLSLYDISSMFVTPQQQAQMQWQANMMAAAPIPASAAAENMNAAMMGMRSGSSGYGGYSPYWARMSTSPSGYSQIPAPSSSYVPTSTTSSSYVPSGGWGQAWNNQGGYAESGYVPQQYYPSTDDLMAYNDPYGAMEFYSAYGELPPS